MNFPTDPQLDIPRRSPNLEPEKVLSAAFRLLDEVGFSGLTLRRLAARLDVKAAALYWHFKNKQDLVDQLAAKIILDEFHKVRHLMDDANWNTVLTITATGLRDALRRYRDGALTIASADINRTGASESEIYVMRRLQEEGFSPELASLALFSITRYTLGFVFEEQAEPRHPDHPVSFDECLELILAGISQKIAK
ncbi:MAG: TetR family transcriptional regulator [Candidatus Saccharimonadales bacterium]